MYSYTDMVNNINMVLKVFLYNCWCTVHACYVETGWIANGMG